MLKHYVGFSQSRLKISRDILAIGGIHHVLKVFESLADGPIGSLNFREPTILAASTLSSCPRFRASPKAFGFFCCFVGLAELGQNMCHHDTGEGFGLLIACLLHLLYGFLNALRKLACCRAAL